MRTVCKNFQIGTAQGLPGTSTTGWLGIEPSLVVERNRAAAVAMSEGPVQRLRLVNDLQGSGQSSPRTLRRFLEGCLWESK